jgi:hypothetical protein
MRAYSGMNSRNAVRLALDLGCEVTQPRRTGELLIAHPLLTRRIRINGRRKDAPRQLTTALAGLATRLSV